MVVAKIIVVLQNKYLLIFLSRFGTINMNILQGLNKSQTEATKVINGPIMVIACQKSIC